MRTAVSCSTGWSPNSARTRSHFREPTSLPRSRRSFPIPKPSGFLNRACTKCHGLEQVQTARKAEEAWRVTLVDMRERGARISDQELEQLVEWLTRVWGTNQDK